jgi:hypothetical protein
MPDRRSRSWLTRNVILLSLSSLFGDISTEMLYSILPVFLTEVLGAGGGIVGLVDGVGRRPRTSFRAFPARSPTGCSGASRSPSPASSSPPSPSRLWGWRPPVRGY